LKQQGKIIFSASLAYFYIKLIISTVYRVPSSDMHNLQCSIEQKTLASESRPVYNPRHQRSGADGFFPKNLRLPDVKPPCSTRRIMVPMVRIFFAPAGSQKQEIMVFERDRCMMIL
jgi:hypothetical protein